MSTLHERLRARGRRARSWRPGCPGEAGRGHRLGACTLPGRGRPRVLAPEVGAMLEQQTSQGWPARRAGRAAAPRYGALEADRPRRYRAANRARLHLRALLARAGLAGSLR
jgi:hypothetical protein